MNDKTLPYTGSAERGFSASLSPASWGHCVNRGTWPTHLLVLLKAVTQGLTPKTALQTGLAFTRVPSSGFPNYQSDPPTPLLKVSPHSLQVLSKRSLRWPEDSLTARTELLQTLTASSLPPSHSPELPLGTSVYTKAPRSVPFLWGVSLQKPLPSLSPSHLNFRLRLPAPPPITHTRPRPPLALTASAGSLSFLRAGGGGLSCTGSAGGRARLRLRPMVRAEARGERLAGLGVLQVGLARDDAARVPGRRRAKKSVRRRCAMASARAGAEPPTEVVMRFAPIFAPRVAPPPPRTKPSARRRGWDRKWMRLGACALMLSGCACAAAPPFGRVWGVFAY